MNQFNGHILYICDREACTVCSEFCFHTTDITHAKNFIKSQNPIAPVNDYWENDHVDGTELLHENDIHAIINAEKTTSIMEGGCKSMSNCDESCLLNGGDCVGMTDGQYKGILLDQLEDWQEVLDMAVEAGNAEIQKKAEKQIAKINEKLKF